ncbi:MAG TPA: phage tail protein [Sedimentisphaerales bacterium]|nr:phage tail protein [Sedimentisphaerales bacterium]
MSSGTARGFAIMGIATMFGGIAGAWVGAAGLAGTTMGSVLVGAAYMGGSFLGQMIFPSPNNRDMPSAPGYPMQSVDKGIAVPLTYGTLRVAGNLVWMGPLSHYHASGGKGGDDGPKQYRRSFLISICEGPRSVLRMWKGKHEIDIAEGTDNKTIVAALITAIAGEVTVFPGDGFNEGLETLIDEDYSSYKNDCCVLFKNYDLGPVDIIPAFVFEVGPWAPVNYYLHNGRGLTFYDEDGNLGAENSGGSLYGLVGATQLDVAKDGSILFMRTNDSTYSSVYYRQSDGTTEDLMPYDITTHSTYIVNGWIPTDYHAQCKWNYVGGCCFNVTGEFAFVGVNVRWSADDGLLERFRVYKINVRTKEIAWCTETPDSWLGYLGQVMKIRVDSSDTPYVGVVGYGNMLEVLGYNIHVVITYKSNGFVLDLVTMLTGNSMMYDFWIDEGFVIYDRAYGEVHTGFLFACGITERVHGRAAHYVRWKKLSDPGLYSDSVFADDRGWLYGWDTGFNCVRTYNNLIYVSGTRQQNAPNHIIQVYNGWGELIDGFDCGPEPNPPDPDYQPSGYGHTMDQNGRIHLVVTTNGQVNGTLYTLTAGTLTEIEDSISVRCYDDVNIVGDLKAFPPFADPYDANPVDIILDLLTNIRYGAGMPGEYINSESFSAIRKYCQEEDLLISVSINSSRPIIDWIQFICSHFGGFPYWVGGQLYLGAWRNEDPVFSITRDHLVVEEDGIPVQIKKRDYSQSINHIELGWQNRDDEYGPCMTPFRDDVDIRLSGKRRKQQIALPGIKRAELATKMGWRYLIDSMYRFSMYTFKLGAKDMLLTPGMVGLISDGFRLTDQRIRITSISEGKEGIGLEIEAVDDISDLYPDLSGRQIQTTLRVPEYVPTLADLEDGTVTIAESDETNELSLSIAPGGEYTDGWRVYLSWDGETYEIYNLVTADSLIGGEANSIGTILTALPAEAATIWRPDQSLTVDIGTITDLRTDVTADEFFNGRSLAKVGDEIIAFRTATETGTEGQWIITDLIRGLYGTTPVAHAVGERFATLDSDIDIPFATSDIGRTVYVKVLTAYGNLSQSLADVEATEYVIRGLAVRPLGVSLVRLTSDEMEGWDNSYSGDSITLHWGLPGRDAGYDLGGYDGGGTWAWGDDELELTPQNGVAWGAYAQDPELQAVDLEFRHESGTLLGFETLGVVSTTTISKATDLGGNNPATVQVYPVRARRSSKAGSISVDDGS